MGSRSGPQESARSFARALLPRVYQDVWERGARYATQGRVGTVEPVPKGVRAIVRGTQRYTVELAWRGTGVSKRCTCPAAARRGPCKHQVAVAMIADQAAGIEPPEPDEIAREVIPPPLISRTDIEALYDDPLHADLETLRLAASESGRWSRPHARLPAAPTLSFGTGSLTVAEVSRAFAQMTRWASHPHFNPYFCAGEMMAAFCQVLRDCQRRWAGTPSEVAVAVLEAAVEFHRRLIYELIDDSDGLHQFGEAHLNVLLTDLQRRAPPPLLLTARLAAINRRVSGT